jgi:hypothetical protein
MIKKTLLAGLLLACAAGSSAAGGVMFGYNFQQGASERYRMKLNTDIEMSGMEMSQMSEMTVKVTCDASDRGKHTMSMVFEKVDASAVMGGNMQTDPSAAEMVGKSVIFTVDANGDVSDITPGPGFDVWPTVQQVVEPILKSWYVYLPSAEVAVGGDWKRENYRDKSDSGAETVTSEYFKFRESRKEKGRDLAIVDSNVSSTVGGSTQTPMGVFTLAGAGKGKFEFAFDPASRTITRIKGSVETSIDMTPESGGSAMKTTVVNHIERELVE